MVLNFSFLTITILLTIKIKDKSNLLTIDFSHHICSHKYII